MEGYNMTIKGFITNLGKYVEGELIGKWIEFPIYDDELQEVLKEIGCNYYDEDGNEHKTGYEEYFLQAGKLILITISKSMKILKNKWICGKLEEWDEDIFIAACESWNVSEILETDPNNWILLSDVNTDYDLGYYYAIECGCIEFGNNEVFERYFDFESYGRDLFFELQGCFTKYGWIEYVGWRRVIMEISSEFKEISFWQWTVMILYS